jgi:hypothetical protein
VDLTLPDAPEVGDQIGVRALDSTNTITLEANGNLIEAASDDMSLDMERAGFLLVYSGATYGWVIVTEIGSSAGVADSRYMLRRESTIEVTDASYDLPEEALAKWVYMTNVGANTVNVRLDSTADLGADFSCTVVQWGAGATSITAVTGVTLNGVDAGTCTISEQYTAVVLHRKSANTWNVFGAHGGVA